MVDIWRSLCCVRIFHLNFHSGTVIVQIHFGEISMQKCEIMLNDLIDSKRTNTNIKATITQPPQTGSFLNL